MKKRKIAIIELNNFHEEVIVPQLGFLKNQDIDVYLFLHSKIKDKNVIDNSMVKKVYYINTSNPLFKLVDLFIKAIIFRFLNFDKVIFNTFSCIFTRLFYIIGGKCKDDTAIIHNVEEYISAKYRFNKIFLLSSNVYKHTKERLKDQNMDFFYPLIRDIKVNRSSEYDDSKLNICIPGKIEYKRRDYKGLVDLLKKSGLKNIQFIILGNCGADDGPDLADYINKMGMSEYFELFKCFVPYDTFVSKLNQCDFIMPLIHPAVKNFKLYHETKISASFTMAYTYYKPLLLFSSLSDLEEFKDISIEYNLDTFTNTLNNLNKDMVKELVTKLKEDNKTSLEQQSLRYLNHLKI